LLRGGRGALVNSSSVSSINAASAAIFARASSSAAASSSASTVLAAEAEPRRSSRGSIKAGEKPARQPRRRSDWASNSGGGGGRTNRGRGHNDGFSGSSSSSSSSAAVSYDQYGDAIPPAVINHAGEGAPGWQLLGEEPEISANFWALDATGGRAGGAPEFAALLSSDAKDAMWAAYKGRG